MKLAYVVLAMVAGISQTACDLGHAGATATPAGIPAAPAAQAVPTVELTEAQQNAIKVEPVGTYSFLIERNAVASVAFDEDLPIVQAESTLIGAAAQSGAHVMMASIEATNAPSVALHARHGFEVVGTAREVGRKFGRWLDLTMMRLAL